MWSNKKKIYYILYSITAKWLPQSRHVKAAGVLRRFWTKMIITEMGDHVNVEKGASFTPELKVGNHSGIGIDCELYGPVSIGDYVMMGPEVVIYTQNHKHESGSLFGLQGYCPIEPVSIGDNVWIGRRVMFMLGSSVGNNCVVAAGACITREFGDNVILGGVPAKVIGKIG